MRYIFWFVVFLEIDLNSPEVDAGPYPSAPISLTSNPSPQDALQHGTNHFVAHLSSLKPTELSPPFGHLILLVTGVQLNVYWTSICVCFLQWKRNNIEFKEAAGWIWAPQWRSEERKCTVDTAEREGGWGEEWNWERATQTVNSLLGQILYRT